MKSEMKVKIVMRMGQADRFMTGKGSFVVWSIVALSLVLVVTNLWPFLRVIYSWHPISVSPHAARVTYWLCGFALACLALEAIIRAWNRRRNHNSIHTTTL